MKQSDNNKFRSENLLQRFFDREIDAEEGYELLEIWRTSPELEAEARKNYKVEYPLVFFSALEKRPLSILSSSDVPENFAEGSFQKKQSAESMVSLEKREGKRIRTSEKHAVKKTLRSLIPLKYVVPLVVLVWISAVYLEFRSVNEKQLSERPFHALGQIALTADAVTGQPHSPLRQGRQIATELISLQKGSIEVFLKNNVRLVLEGPGEFQMISQMNMFCSKGRLSVFVPQEAVGFEVTTPNASIIDRGTAFVVNVMEERSELHVIEGKVDASAQTKEPLSFMAGLGARITDLGKIIRRPADLTLYVDPVEMKRRAAVSQAREKEKEQMIANRLKQDPSVFLFLDFEDENNISSGITVEGCRCVPGKNSDNRALLFQKRNDVVYSPGSLKTDSLTLLANIRVDRLSRTTQTLFTCREFDEGAVQWQIDRQGRLQILIGRGANQAALNYSSESVIKPWLYKTWIQLASVLDGKNQTITHYMDGVKVGQNTMEMPVRFHLSEMEIGNWTQKERTPTLRYFDGAVDDIVIFNKALTKDEIQDLSYFY